MKLVKKNLQNLFLKHRRFAVLILLTQIIGTFSVCFAVGVLYNNQYVLLEDSNSTKEIRIYFNTDNENCIYEDVQKTLKKIYDVFGQALTQISFQYFQYEEDMITFASFAGWNGSYYYDGFFQELEYQIYEGRNLKEEDFVNKYPAAVVTGSYQGEKVQAYGKDFELVGRRNKDDTFLPVVFIPITCWEGIPVNYVVMRFTRIPSNSEYERVCAILEKDMPGKYEISDYYAGDADYQALYRSLSIVVGAILLSIVCTLIMLYGYVYETRRYSLTVIKLCGCRHLMAALVYIAESVFLVVPSCLAGVLLFILVRTWGLDKSYPYIKTVFDTGMYLKCAGSVLLVVFLEAVLLSAFSTRGSVKDQMRGNR